MTHRPVRRTGADPPGARSPDPTDERMRQLTGTLSSKTLTWHPGRRELSAPAGS